MMKTEGTKSDSFDTESEDETGNEKKTSSKIIVLSDYVITPANNTAARPQLARAAKVTKTLKSISKKTLAKKIVTKKHVKKVESRKPDKTPKDDFAKTSKLASVILKTQFATETSDVPQIMTVDVLNYDTIQRESTVANESLTKQDEALRSSTKFNQMSRSPEIYQLTSYGISRQKQVKGDESVILEGDSDNTVNIIAQNPAITQSSNQQNLASTSNAGAEEQSISPVLKEQLDILKRQNAQILSKLSKEFDKKRIYADSDIKKMLPCRSVDAYESWDGQVSTDEELYKATRRYLHKFKGEAKNTNYYGSVLIRIVTDDVISHYNFDGIKEKFRLKDSATVELISDIYKPTDRIEFEKRMRATIGFAKSRYNSLKFQNKKRAQKQTEKTL